jgi:hypothetical protein
MTYLLDRDGFGDAALRTERRAASTAGDLWPDPYDRPVSLSHAQDEQLNVHDSNPCSQEERCRTCCLRASRNTRPLRCMIFRGSIPHASRQWPSLPSGTLPYLDFHRLDRASFAWRLHLLDHLVGESEKLPPAPRAIGRAKLFRSIVTFSRGRRPESAWSSRCNLLRVSSE